MMRLLLFFLCVSSMAFGLYMGNPAEVQIIDEGFFIPQNYSVTAKAGYQGDVVFNRRLQTMGRGHIDTCKIRMNQGVLILNYLDRVELYGSMGAINCHFSKRKEDEREKFRTHDHWTVGGGLRFVLAQWGNTGIGMDGKIQYGKPPFESHSRGHLAYHEWQASFAAFHTIDLFTPYLGLKFSDVHADVNGIKKEFEMTNRCRWGIALGCTLSQGKKIDLNVEVQLFDEEGVTFGGNLKF